MHPEVVANEPGTCPICRMALERKDDADASMGRPNDEVEAIEGVRRHNVVEFVRKRSLLPHSRDMYGAAWIEADGSVSAIFYRDQVDALAADERGMFSLTRAPEMMLAVRRAAVSPENWDDSTARVHFQVESSAGQTTAASFHAGDAGWLELARRARDVLAVPASAILQSPDGPYVLAWTGIGYQFEKRPIEIGETFLKYGFAVVLSGLRPNERVVAKAAFFLDAERRMAGRSIGGGSAAP